MPPIKGNYTCNICQRTVSSNFSLQRHYREVHNQGATTYKCKHCDHVSKRVNDLQKHVGAKHRDVAQPSELTKSNRLKPMYQTSVGQTLMAETIAAALKKPKRRPVITSSGENTPERITVFDPEYTTPEYSPIRPSETNSDCKVIIAPLRVPTPEIITLLPPASPEVIIIDDENDIGPVIECPTVDEIVNILPTYYFENKEYLDSGDETPTRDENVSTDYQLYSPITEPISPVDNTLESPLKKPTNECEKNPNNNELILPYPDYSKYAINSPIRVNALTDLFQGSRKMNLLEMDLQISDADTDSDSDNASIHSMSTIDFNISPTSNQNLELARHEQRISTNQPTHNDQDHQSENNFGTDYESQYDSEEFYDEEDYYYERQQPPYRVIVHRKIVETTETFYFN